MDIKKDKDTDMIRGEEKGLFCFIGFLPMLLNRATKHTHFSVVTISKLY